MAYFHGIKTSELPTKILPTLDIESGLIFAVGTAPCHLATNPAKANTPTLCYELSEYVEQFGYDGNFSDYTLDEVASSAFQLFKIAPVVFVNVLDVNKHFREVTQTVSGIIETPAKIKNAVILDSLKITSGEVREIALMPDTDYRAETNITEDGPVTTIDIIVGTELPSDELKIYYTQDEVQTSITKNVSELPFELPLGALNISVKAVVSTSNVLVKDEDYVAAYNSDNEVEITILDDEKILNDTVEIYFHEVDPSKVKPADIIGGYDAVTGQYKGLETVEDVFPKFRVTVGIIISPKFSQDVTVAAIMKAKCYDQNNVFNSIAVCDIPTAEVKNYTAAAEYKNKKNLIDPALVACYPKVSLGGVQYFLSTQLACLMNQVDAQRGDGIPYISPSNKRLQIDSACLEDGTEIFFGLDKVSYLNGQGIVTALNFSNGWTAYGNRTSVYPSSTDVKDNFISIRRTFLWLRNTLTLTYFSKIDDPLNKRLVESVVDSVNIFLNGLTAKGVLNGGRIKALSGENPTTDVMDGIIKFHLYINVPSPARVIEFMLEYDPSYLSSLFE